MVVDYPQIQIANEDFGFKGNLELSFFNYGNTPIVVTAIGLVARQNNTDITDKCEGSLTKDFYFKTEAFIVKASDVALKRVATTSEMTKIARDTPKKSGAERIVDVCFTIDFVALERIWTKESYLGRWGTERESIPVPAGRNYSPHVLIDRILPIFGW